jgi:hypothetical protein
LRCLLDDRTRALARICCDSYPDHGEDAKGDRPRDKKEPEPRPCGRRSASGPITSCGRRRFSRCGAGSRGRRRFSRCGTGSRPDRGLAKPLRQRLRRSFRHRLPRSGLMPSPVIFPALLRVAQNLDRSIQGAHALGCLWVRRYVGMVPPREAAVGGNDRPGIVFGGDLKDLVIIGLGDCAHWTNYGVQSNISRRILTPCLGGISAYPQPPLTSRWQAACGTM